MPLTEALPTSESFANDLGAAAEAREALFVGSRDFIAVVAFQRDGGMAASTAAQLNEASPSNDALMRRL
jgi:hypothetical protein